MLHVTSMAGEKKGRKKLRSPVSQETWPGKRKVHVHIAPVLKGEVEKEGMGGVCAAPQQVSVRKQQHHHQMFRSTDLTLASPFLIVREVSPLPHILVSLSLPSRKVHLMPAGNR